jgi:hypothetical protein
MPFWKDFVPFLDEPVEKVGSNPFGPPRFSEKTVGEERRCLPEGRMAWEAIEEDEHDLLEASNYPVRKEHYTAMQRGLVYYVLVLAIVLGLMFIMVWFVPSLT